MRTALREAGIAPRSIVQLPPLPAVSIVRSALRASIIAGLLDERSELVECHRELAHRKRPRKSYAMLRTFTRIAFLLIRGRAHSERPRRHHHHLRTGVAFRKSVFRFQRALALGR